MRSELDGTTESEIAICQLDRLVPVCVHSSELLSPQDTMRQTPVSPLVRSHAETTPRPQDGARRELTEACCLCVVSRHVRNLQFHGSWALPWFRVAP